MKAMRFVLVACVMLVAAQAGAQTMYGTIHNGSSPSTFVELDPTTGAQIASIGSVGYAVNGMAWDATTGTLFATTATSDGSFPSGLITIDPATGAGTPVGSGAGILVNVPTVNAAGDLFGWTEDTDDLVLWDKAAGTVTVVGDAALSTLAQGLDFDAAGSLYLVNGGDFGKGKQTTDAEVYLIDSATGVPTYLGPVGPLPYAVAHHGKFNPVDGYYYGIDRRPQNASTGYQLVRINVATQTIVGFLPTVDNLHTIVYAAAAQPPEPTAVPALSGLGLTIMVMLLAAVAVVLVRRFA